jgi:hypothetical protein
MARRRQHSHVAGAACAQFIGRRPNDKEDQTRIVDGMPMEKLHGGQAPDIGERVVARVGRYHGIAGRNGGRSDEACTAGHSGAG